MKLNQHASNRPEAPGAASRDSSCLPFCGLGAQEHLERQARFMGLTRPEQRAASGAVQAGLPTES